MSTNIKTIFYCLFSSYWLFIVWKDKYKKTIDLTMAYSWLYIALNTEIIEGTFESIFSIGKKKCVIA